jgi:hypothetical protein
LKQPCGLVLFSCSLSHGRIVDGICYPDFEFGTGNDIYVAGMLTGEFEAACDG